MAWKKRSRLAVIAGAVALGSLAMAGNASASVIAAQTSGTSTTTSPAYVATQVTIPSGVGTWDDLVFNYYADIAATPVAYGTVYLLTQSYTGAPDSLSASTPGFLAQATASNNAFTFAPDVTLDKGATYYFYQDGSAPEASPLTYGSGSSSVTVSSASTSYSSLPGTSSINYQLAGIDPPPVPEPAAVGLVGIGCLALLARHRKLV